MFVLQGAQLVQQPVALSFGVGLQAFVVDNIQHLFADTAGKSGPTECREKLGPFGKTVSDGPRGDQRADWMSISERFTQDDNVRHNLLLLKPEIKVAQSSQPGLHFVSNAQATNRTNFRVNRLQITFWRDYLATDRGESFCDEPCNFYVLNCQTLNCAINQTRKFLCTIRVVSPKTAAVIIRHFYQFDPIRWSDTTFGIELISR